MKNIFSKFVMITAISFSLSACSTPEERAEVIDEDATSQSADSSGSISRSSNMNSNPTDTSMAGDSSAGNKKMESFRHVPIDTAVTSFKDTTKH